MFLYFIEAGDAIKVGVATNVESRMIDIQVGNAGKIKLIHSISLIKDKARKMEQLIHGIFYKTRIRGEWFKATPFMFDYIQNIKDHGIDTHYDWIEYCYKEPYGKILEKLEQIIKADIKYGNLVSGDLLKRDVNYLIDPFQKLFDKKDNLSASIKEWVSKIPIGKRFSIKSLYNHLGAIKRRHRQAISRVLSRMVKDRNIIQRYHPSGTFIKITGT